jgi:hypothetical protein
MEKISNWVKQKKELLFIVFMFLIWINGCQTNNQFRKEIQVLNTHQEHIRQVNDSLLLLYKSIPTKNYIDKSFAIEGYRISKRILYDNNLIVRTKERPDDRMNEYDNEIDKLRQDAEMVRK